MTPLSRCRCASLICFGSVAILIVAGLPETATAQCPAAGGGGGAAAALGGPAGGFAGNGGPAALGQMQQMMQRQAIARQQEMLRQQSLQRAYQQRMRQMAQARRQEAAERSVRPTRTTAALSKPPAERLRTTSNVSVQSTPSRQELTESQKEASAQFWASLCRKTD